MSPTPPSLQRLGERLFYRGRKFAFEAAWLRLPNGAEGVFETIRHPGGAMAVPIDRQGRFVLVEQFRFALDAWILEFPAGTLEPGEAPATTIRRELEEEVAYRAASWSHLGDFPVVPGYSDEVIHAFLARDLEALAEPPAQDPDEDLRTVHLTGAEMEDAVRAGWVDAKTVSGLFLFQRS